MSRGKEVKELREKMGMNRRVLGMESTGSTVMTSKFIKPDKGIKLL